MSTSVGILVPMEITDPMFFSSTIAEPAPSETLWVSAAAYALGERRIRTTTHRVYSATAAHSGRTTLPELDFDFWNDEGPTLKWAALDGTESTPSRVVTPLTMVLRPGFFNALAIYGLDGALIDITIKESPAGPLFFSTSVDLQEVPLDEYDWCFGRIKPLTRVVELNLLPFPEAELTISITAGTGVTVGVGEIVLGDFRQLIGDAPHGGAKHGASAEPVSKSYIEEKLGRVKIVKRHSATDLRMQVHMPRMSADYALATIQEVLDVPCSLIATDVPGYGGLSGFGLVTGPLSYDSPATATFNLSFKGMF